MSGEWIRHCAAGLAAALMLAPATQAMAADKADAAKLFGARPSVEAIDLSPDGQRVVFIAPGPGSTSLARVAELGSGKPPAQILLSSGRPEHLRWCRFAGNRNLVCRMDGIFKRPEGLVPFSRLLTVRTDGTGLQTIGQKQSMYDARLRQFDGEILDWLPDQDGQVLMSRDYIPEAGKIGTRMVRSADGTGVDRIDLETMRSVRVEAPDRRADFFMSDGQGQVRIKGFRVHANGQLTGEMLVHYRLRDSRDWLPFSTLDGKGNGLLPLAVDAASNSAYVLKKLDGRDALYRTALDGSLATELVFASATVDVDGVIRAGHKGEVIGVTWAEDKRHVEYFSERYRALAEALAKAIPDLPMIGFGGTDATGNRVLVHAGSDADPGRYYLFDTANRKLEEILLSRDELEDVPLASVRPMSYPARDGTRIPAYLTLPPGAESAAGLPGIVLPHGGPSARDEWGFDWLAQFLAQRGYAVLQPNYRGSAGFGDEWLQENGFRGWRTSVGDIVDGGRWLLSEGKAAADRLAIVGWSYGGYAALQSSVVEPELFRAVVAIAPVTDMMLLKRDADGYTNANLVGQEIGRGSHLNEGSPLRNAGRIQSPVLMFHGTHDMNVTVDHSRRMDAALKSAGKASELVVFDGLEHSLEDSDARVQMLSRIDAFLRQPAQP